jgi:hypothetical protein
MSDLLFRQKSVPTGASVSDMNKSAPARTNVELAKAVVTDSHFLIPVAVFLIGLVLLFILR